METILACFSLVSDARGRARRPALFATILIAGLAALAACSAQVRRAPAESATVDRSDVLTVPQLQQMAEQGTPIGVILGKIDASGTVYRLDTQQLQDLRAVGMPASLVSYVEQTYLRAVQKNPDLAKSDAHWTKIDGYWYGGLPFGWPREWVVGAPSFGEAFR